MRDHFYLLYLDEIYNPNLKDVSKLKKEKLLFSLKHHHFGLAGTIIPVNELNSINFATRRLQNKYYPKLKLPILHYVDILHTRDAFSDLHINAKKKSQFLTSINNYLMSLHYHLLFVFIDIHQLIKEYGVFDNKEILITVKKIKYLFPEMDVKSYNLYYLCLRLLLCQFYEYLIRHEARGMVIAESRGKVEDKELRDAFDLVHRNGVNQVAPTDLRGIIPEIFIIDKSQNHAGLQISDLVLYPTYDYYVPLHSVRKDHFISQALIHKKLYKKRDSVIVFPK